MLTSHQLEGGGRSTITMEENNSTATMCNLEDWFIRNKIRIYIPRNMLQGSAKIFIRNFISSTVVEEITTTIDEEGVKVIDMYLIQNRETNYFTRLVKVMLI